MVHSLITYFLNNGCRVIGCAVLGFHMVNTFGIDFDTAVSLGAAAYLITAKI